MKTFQWNLLVILFFGALITSCEEPATESTTPEATETEAITEVPTKTTEVDDATFKKLADEYRQYIDEGLDKTIDKAVYEYTCDGWGGSLTLGKEGEVVVYKEQLSGGEDGAKWVRFYTLNKNSAVSNKDITDMYNEDDEVVMVWTLSKLFAGDDVTSEETIFYLRRDVLVDAVQRSAKGTVETIDKNLAMAEYVAIKGDAVSDYQVMHRDLLEMDIENIQAHFCE